MSRYVFSSRDAIDAKGLSAAKRAARTHGAVVVKALSGTLLLDLEPRRLDELAQALPGWRYSAERKSARVPERSPLQRAALAAAGKA